MDSRTYYYARVSSKEQNLDRQIAAFKALGATDREIITDKAGRMFMIMHAHCEGLIPRRGDYRPRPMILMELKDINGRLTFVDHKGNPTAHPTWFVSRPEF